MSEGSFIETQFPIALLSAESYKERKAATSQTLPQLGKWWGRKPLVLVRAGLLGLLMPASDDPKRDREIFLKLMTMDPDGLWRRRKAKINDTDILKRAPEYKETWRATPKDERDQLREEVWKNLSDEDRAALEENRRFKYTREEFDALPYEKRLSECVRPEEVDGPGPDAWAEINEHLGTSGKNLPEIVDQLGRRQFGHRPTVGDCFCGGGSVPFEAARVGCNVWAGDLNPVAGLLTWAGLRVLLDGSIGVEDAQARLASAFRSLQNQVQTWGIETSEEGWMAEAYLYCVEAVPPGSNCAIPLSPSWVISEKYRVCAIPRLAESGRRFDLDVISGADDATWRSAKSGELATVRNNRVVHPSDPDQTWPLEAIRGPEGFRRWERADVAPRPDDALQERLYCIRWRTNTGERVYRAPTSFDLTNEHRVTQLLSDRLPRWHELGRIPDDEIPPGYNTDQPVRERGWTHWHHLFAPRQLLLLCSYLDLVLDECEDAPVSSLVAALLSVGSASDFNSRLCRWIPHLAASGGIGAFAQTFYNQALNTLYNYGCRSVSTMSTTTLHVKRFYQAPRDLKREVVVCDARDIASSADLWVTDPPYADAVNYHELADFYLAWYRQTLRSIFPEWSVDSRQALAVRGSGGDFKRSMVEVYSNLARHMPDNGLQLVMFTHQHPAVWADLGMILWAAGLRVTAAWTVATETPAGGIKKGNYVQGTVLLVLRKRLGEQHGFLDEVYPMVEDEVRRQIDSMRALDDGAEPNFGDTDYQLAAYAAALRVLTQFQTLDGQDIGHELFRSQENSGRGRGRNAEKSRFEQVIDRGIEIACEYLIPRGLDKVWRGLTPDERLYLRALDVESRGEHRQGVYQELARGFGVREFRPLLQASTANSTRVKTPGEFGRRALTGDGFGGTKLRQLVFAIYTTRSDENPDAGLRYLKDEVANYWGERQRLIAVLDWLAELGRAEGMVHWLEDSEAARLLAGRLRGDHG